MAEVIKSPPLVSDTHVISQADAESMIKSEEVDAEQSGPPTPVELDPSFVTNDQSTNEQTTHQAELQVQQRQELSAKLEQLTNENAGLEQTVEQLQEQLQNQQQAIENSNEATLQSGYQDGYQAGEQAASEEWSELIQTFLTLLESVNHAYQDLIEHEEDAVIDIVLTAVQKILGKQLITEKGILAMIKETITHAKQLDNLVVRVNPDDFDIVEHHKDKLDRLKSSPNISIQADAKVQLGGCILESPLHTIDGRLETQYQRFVEVLMNAKQLRSEKK